MSQARRAFRSLALSAHRSSAAPRRPAARRRRPWAAGGGIALAALLVVAGCAPSRTVPEARSPAQPPVVRVEPPMTQDPRFTGPARVALLLPLSGPNASIGLAMQNAAQMALFDVGNPDFELLPVDTGGTPEGAALAARDSVERGARLILGPLFASNVPPVAREAGTAGINVIAFTTDATVAGGNAMVMGFLPGTEVDRVVRFAQSRGLNSFAVIAPDTDYGRLVVDAMRRVTQTRGAQLAAVEFYGAGAQDFTGLVERVANTGTVDAVMLPDTGLRVRAIGSLIPFYGLRGTRILGTGLWHGANVGVEQALRGAWYAAPQPQSRADFEQRYAQLYGAPPPLVAALAYDAVALAARLAEQQPGGRTYDIPSLTSPDGFAGITGIFRFRSDGLVERGLAVLEVTSQQQQTRVAADAATPAEETAPPVLDGAVVIDPAPTTFVGAGF